MIFTIISVMFYAIFVGILTELFYEKQKLSDKLGEEE